MSASDLTGYCLDELERVFRTEAAPEDVAAIVVEPVQGEGGFVVPTPGFLPGLSRICDLHGIVLIVDEVQSGFGRTGKMWAMEHEDVDADLVTVGKSLGAGLPLSGVVGRADILDSAAPGSIGGTYGGNPLACAAALAVFIPRGEARRGARIGRIVQARFGRARHPPTSGDSCGSGAMRPWSWWEDRPRAGRSPRTCCARSSTIASRAGWWRSSGESTTT